MCVDVHWRCLEQQMAHVTVRAMPQGCPPLPDSSALTPVYYTYTDGVMGAGCLRHPHQYRRSQRRRHPETTQWQGLVTAAQQGSDK